MLYHCLDAYTTYETQTNTKIAELEGVIKGLETKIETLEAELDNLKQERTALENKYSKLVDELEEEKRVVQDTIEKAARDKEAMDKKWHTDFENLRTINIMKEQQLLDDFEWKLREVEQKCKKRLEEMDKKGDERLQDAYKEAHEKMAEAEKLMNQV